MPTAELETADDGRYRFRKRADDSIEAARLAHEARVLRSLAHPNVAVVTDSDDSSLLLDYAGRTDLNQLEPTDLDQVSGIGASVLATLADVASMGWSHGAVGPAHCVIGDRGRVTMCSWGRARKVSSADSRWCLADVADTAAMLRLLTDQLDDETGRDARRRRERWTSLLDELIARPVPAKAAAEQISTFVDLGVVARRRGGTGAPRRVARRAHARPTVWQPALNQAALLAVSVAAVVSLLALWHPTGTTRESVARVSAIPAVVTLTVSIVRWAALGAAAYGAAIAALGLIGTVARREAWLDLQRRLAPRLATRLLAALTGLGVAATTASPLLVRSDPPATVTTETVDDPVALTGPSTTPSTTTLSTPPTTSTIAPPTTLVSPTMAGPGPAAPTSTGPAATEPVPVLGTWTIRRGDHLWRVARRTLADRLGRTPSTHETAIYWERLIAQNRGVLVDPDNPDLLFVGQVLTLPPGTTSTP